MDLPSLDVAYFTSLSYYILLLFGLRGVFMLFFREATIDETQMYRQQMGLGGGGPGANPMAAMAGGDPNKALEAERAALELVRARMGAQSGRACLGVSCVSLAHAPRTPFGFLAPQGCPTGARRCCGRPQPLRQAGGTCMHDGLGAPEASTL